MNKRIDKLLSSLGYGSRKEIKQMINSCVVTSAGAIIKDNTQVVNPRNIKISNKSIKYYSGVNVILNKPIGYVCTRKSVENSIFKLFPNQEQKKNLRFCGDQFVIFLGRRNLHLQLFTSSNPDPTSRFASFFSSDISKKI